MISVERKVINNIPVLEMTDYDKANDYLPLVLYFHGVTNQKEHGLQPGYELAQRGFRVVVPDAYLHGERKNEPYTGAPEMQFWTIILKSIQELPALVEEYEATGLASKADVTVAGLSMGAITTCMALTKYPWIKAGASLMGTPDPVGFTQWLLRAGWVLDRYNVSEEIMTIFEAKLQPYSLKDHPEAIAGKPFYIFHGTADETVPFGQMRVFVESLKGKNAGDLVHFERMEGQGHKVPHAIFRQMAVFLTDKLQPGKVEQPLTESNYKGE